MKRWFVFFFRWSFWLACALVIVGSLIPTDQLPPLALDVWDKAQHAFAFAGLFVLGAWAYPRRVLWIALGLLMLGGAIELLQWQTGWRIGEWADWIADAIGVAVAMWWWLSRRSGKDT
jgi:VanZ family protein